MREIKFRAWDGCQMQSVVYVGDNEVYTCPKCIPMQYTGLKDKNGTEIYEGDILSYDDGRITYVTWHDYTARFDSIGVTSKGVPHPLSDRPELLAEVIGNIYENPELLEV